MMRFLLFTCFYLILGVLSAQDSGHNISFELKNYDSSELIVGYYLGKQTLVQDTLRSEASDGKFTLSGEEPLKHGVYLMLTQPEVKFIQFLVEEDQDFTIKTNAANLGEVKFEGSAENKRFYDYLDFIKENRTEITKLNEQKSHLDSLNKSVEDVTKKISKINAKVRSKQKEVAEKNPNSLITMLINANKQIDIPEYEGTEEEVKLKKFKYYKAHYFDFIALDRPETLRTPFLHERITYYFEKLTPTHPDSINKSVDIILAKTKPAEDTYKYYLSHFLNKYHGSKVVGYDAVYVHLALNYYAKGEASWVDEENLEKIIDKAKRTQPVLIGKQAPDFTAKDKDGLDHTLSKIDADYKVLMFWKPDCGHCKKAMPHVVEFQDKFKNNGVKVISFCTDGRKNIKKCWEGVEEKEMGNLLNLADEQGRSRAQAKFYATSTPYIYILDRAGKILMKRIGAEQLEEVMDELIKIDKGENGSEQG